MPKKAKKTNAYGEPMLTCPECGSANVTVREETTWMANTGELYCHSVKAYDAEAAARCLECGWTGRRDGLKQGGAA